MPHFPNASDNGHLSNVASLKSTLHCNQLTSCSEWCELGCEESDLDLYLDECRNACNAEFEDEIGKEAEGQLKNKLEQYLDCMHKMCLREGRGPEPEIRSDRSWLRCAQQCDREPSLMAHEATEKSVFRTQYLSDQQFENFKIINKLEANAKKPKSKAQTRSGTQVKQMIEFIELKN